MVFSYGLLSQLQNRHPTKGSQQGFACHRLRVLLRPQQGDTTIE